MHEDIFWLAYSRSYSVTAMLVQLGLPTFDTLLHNSHVRLAVIVITVLLQNSSYYILSFFKVVNIIACVLFVVSIISFFFCVL